MITHIFLKTSLVTEYHKLPAYNHDKNNKTDSVCLEEYII